MASAVRHAMRQSASGSSRQVGSSSLRHFSTLRKRSKQFAVLRQKKRLDLEGASFFKGGDEGYFSPKRVTQYQLKFAFPSVRGLQRVKPGFQKDASVFVKGQLVLWGAWIESAVKLANNRPLSALFPHNKMMSPLPAHHAKLLATLSLPRLVVLGAMAARLKNEDVKP
mmetsp:Transcript_21768/g.42295  ORF Transcript_21768/g.42295 Transcript_21768/m.42295 type:complete len:168 (+) Transcript_21768:3-506(+)